MRVTATELANDSKGILDTVIERSQAVTVERHGRPVAEIRPTVGVSLAELQRRLSAARFTRADTAELRRVIDESGKVLGYAGRD